MEIYLRRDMWTVHCLQIDQLNTLPEFAAHFDFREGDADLEEVEEEEDEDGVFALTDYPQHSTAEHSRDLSPQLQTAEILQHQKQVLRAETSHTILAERNKISMSAICMINKYIM